MLQIRNNRKYKEYLIGGAVRDKILGINSKDRDYTFVFEDINQFESVNDAFKLMYEIISGRGEIYLSTPEAFTIRYKESYTNELKDVVLARKEIYPNPISRMPVVEIGTLFDDQKRRDFTLNTIAEDEDGNLIDPFNGQEDLGNMVLRCPVDAQTSFMDDPLRMIRALRFIVTKGFNPDEDIIKAFENEDIWAKFDMVVSRERVRDELFKMFYANTYDAMNVLSRYLNPEILKYRVFKEDIWLKPTTTKR